MKTHPRYRARFRQANPTPLLTTYDLTVGTPAGRYYHDAVLRAGYVEQTSEWWPSEAAGLGDILGVVFRDGENDVVVQTPDGRLAHVQLRWGELAVTAAGPDQGALGSLCAAFRKRYPASYLVDADSRVPVTFWALSPHGPVPRLRRVEAATWDDVRGNYTAAVRDQLASLMAWKNEPGASGQLILWQGPPGTGKTWALRSLISEWSPWVEAHYITDPDSFFVDDSSYMVGVLLADSYSVIDQASGDLVDEQRDGKWRLLILEDTGELLSAGAKEKYGQGLSRLLNVVDGLIGQGLRVLVLVTTNDELGELHPAVRRPGRCASAIEFHPLTSDEASAWVGDDADGPLTIAELYARQGDGSNAGVSAEDAALVASAHTAATPGLGRLLPALRTAADVEAFAANATLTEVFRVAKEHQPDEPGYGQTAYNAETGAVLWVCWDGTSMDEINAARAAFLALPGVVAFDYEYEALPDGWWDAQVVYPEDPPRWVMEEPEAEAHALERVVALARSPLPPLDTPDDPGATRDAPDAPGGLTAAALALLGSTHDRTVQAVERLVAGEHDAANLPAITERALDALTAAASRETPAPTVDVTVNPPAVTVNHTPPAVEVRPEFTIRTPEQPAPVVHIAAAAPPVVNFHAPEQLPPYVDVHVEAPAPSPAPAVNVTVQAPAERPPTALRVEVDPNTGVRRYVPER